MKLMNVKYVNEDFDMSIYGHFNRHFTQNFNYNVKIIR